MALNKYMHPRNIYKSRKPDFKDLAIKYDYFKEKVTMNLSGKVILDFKDPTALRALTQALLEDDFGLQVSLPIDRLIPTVPQRLNYILWLEDIVGKQADVKGIDIGTGASCIYPLLGCKQNGWSFLASDIDDLNLQFARQNVQQNKMEDKITVKKVTEATMLNGLAEDGVSYDFCMCNPPFFSDHLEAQGISKTRSDTRPDAHSVCTASEGESIHWGGEVRFVKQMIEESLILKDRVRVYTSMLGKKMSLSLIKDELKKRKIPNFSSTEFCQGKTMRWAIAWTFDTSVQFPKSAFKEQKKTKPPITYVVPRTDGVVSDYTVQAYTSYIKSALQQLKINYHMKHSGKFYTCLILQAKENTWSNQRRKRRQSKQQASATKQQASDDVDTCTQQAGGSNLAVTSLGDKSEVAEKNNVSSTENIDDIPTEKSVQKPDGSEINRSTQISNSGDNVCDADNKHEIIENVSSGNAELESIENSEKISDLHDNGFKPGEKSSNKKENDKNLDEMELGFKSDKSDSDVSASKTSVKRSVADRGLEGIDDGEPGSEFKRFKAAVDKSKAQFDKQMALNGGKTCVTQLQGEKVSENNKIDQPGIITRKDIVKQFWAEVEAKQINTQEKWKVPKSEFEKDEPFSEEEECLVLWKLVLRKDEGVMTLTLTYIKGDKESLHQIMQFFKNRLSGQTK